MKIIEDMKRDGWRIEAESQWYYIMRKDSERYYKRVIYK